MRVIASHFQRMIVQQFSFGKYCFHLLFRLYSVVERCIGSSNLMIVVFGIVLLKTSSKMSDKQTKQYMMWLEEEDTDEVDIGPQDTGWETDTDGPSEHEEVHTETEQSVSDSDDSVTVSRHVNRDTYRGKDGSTIWFKQKAPPSKIARQNIVTQLPGVIGGAKNLKSILDCWKLFFPDSLITRIVQYTNVKLKEMAPSYSRNTRDCPLTDFEEISAFLGVLYLAGVKKSQHLNTDELWATDGTAPDFFIASMSKLRFHTLLQAVRFDDITTRAQRKQEDNLSPITEIFDDFFSVCMNSYRPSAYTTIDEMLEAFKGRCKFRQYIANKPAKYGIKIYALCDARTFYTLNMEIYVGKQPSGPYQVPNDAQNVVLRLIRPIDNSGRNVTMDNYFTSIPLANELYTNHRLTLVGTLRLNKREIPPEFLSVKERLGNSSMFAFGEKPSNNCLLCSYVPKKKQKKNVMMISTMHNDDGIDPDSGEAKKPEVITFYNLTKGGVDVVDRLKSEYSVSRISNRWPLTIFFSLLNIGVINAQIIYKTNTGNLLTRRKFVTQLSMMLTKPHMMRRMYVSLRLKEKIKSIASIESLPKTERTLESEEKSRCAYCPKRKNRFTYHSCSKCSSPICKEHTETTVYVCRECAAKEVDSESD